MKKLSLITFLGTYILSIGNLFCAEAKPKKTRPADLGLSCLAPSTFSRKIKKDALAHYVVIKAAFDHENPQKFTPKEIEKNRQYEENFPTILTTKNQVACAYNAKEEYGYESDDEDLSCTYCKCRVHLPEEKKVFRFKKKLFGGAFSKRITGPNPALGLEEGQSISQLECIYVLPEYQRSAIGKSLLSMCVGRPAILFLKATNEAGRKFFEKNGFTLVTDEEHPDGKGTEFVRALCETDPETCVGYRKN